MDKFRIMRGIPIRDCNFMDPGNSWESGGELGSADWEQVAATPTFDKSVATDDYGGNPFGTGSSLAITLADFETTGTTDYMTSSYTPRGVGCGPCTSGMPLTLWFGALLKTYNVASGNAAELLRVQVLEYDEDGGTLGNSGTADSLTADSDYSSPEGFKYAQNWGLWTAKVNLTAHEDTRFYRLRLYANKDTAGASGARVIVDWVGLGIPFDASTGYDELSSWYDATPVHGGRGRVRWMSPDGSLQPSGRVEGFGGKYRTQSFTFNRLTEADKRSIEAVHQWTQGGRTAGETTADGNLYASNRGTAAPAIIVPNRESMKQAMYCKFPEPQFSPSIGWMPETGCKWSTALTFTERRE